MDRRCAQWLLIAQDRRRGEPGVAVEVGGGDTPEPPASLAPPNSLAQVSKPREDGVSDDGQRRLSLGRLPLALSIGLSLRLQRMESPGQGQPLF